MSSDGRMWRWAAPVGVALVVAVMAMTMGLPTPPAPSPARAEAAKRECAAALASSIGHSTTGYADKLAYEAVVRDKCAGFSIDGKPIGR